MKDVEIKVFSEEKPVRRKIRRVLPAACLLIPGFLMLAAMYGKRIGIAGMLLGMGLEIILCIFAHTGKRMGLCMFFISLAALLFVMYRPAALYDAVYGAEGYVTRTFRLLTGRTDGQVNGEINRGNNHRIGVTQLELAVSEKPTETLYLKNFTGGIYEGNRWESADDDEVVREVAKDLGWKNWIEMARGMYRSSSFILNQYTRREDPPQARNIYVRRQSTSSGMFYVPYYSRESWNRQNAKDMWEIGYKNQYQYYEQKDMDIRWDDLDDQMGDSRAWYRSILDAYREAAQRVYTQVPKGAVPELKKYVEENPREGLDEITAFITDTLEKKTSYTLTPGWAPVNEDIVDYFLFGSGEGYCQHFASAAALMYQMYGIPARYASGYALQPGDFTQGPGKLWEAKATDESAHAWVEIYLEDYGWTPVEVTPSADGVIRAAYPDYSYDSSGQTEGRGSSGKEGTEDDRGSRTDTADASGKSRYEEGFSVYFDLKKYGEIYRSVGVFLSGIVVSALLYWYDRRQQYQERLRCMGCRSIFSVMMKTLHRNGYFPELSGGEADFSGKISGEFPQVSAEEMKRFQEIVEEAAYGKEQPEAEDEEFVRAVCFRIMENVRAQRGFLHRRRE